MKRVVLALIALGFSGAAVAQSSVYVPGYVRSDGTYVQGHYRSAPDSSVYNNYSTRGNVNPYTGKAGTRDPYSSSPRSTYSNPYAPKTYKAPCYYNCPN